ncbi:unnamed protein product [Lasius platythorax]|uniref:Methyltransferase type 12 domain-containing protein n=1 Tax=Lasius platythorax TaxID=488582 RepID=A0AAV2N506_9HYME
MEFNPEETVKEINVSWYTHGWNLVDEKLMLPGKCMEINCAFGNTTRYHLLPELNKKSTIIGTDSSEMMIEYAKRKYKNDERFDFDILDIQTKNLPEKYIAEFDHIFSYPTVQYR